MSKAPAAVKRQVARTKLYKSLFNSPDGRLVLIDLMRRSGMLETVSGSAEEALRAEGRRSLVLEIMAELRFNENELLALAEERMDEIDEEE